MFTCMSKIMLHRQQCFPKLPTLKGTKLYSKLYTVRLFVSGEEESKCRYFDVTVGPETSVVLEDLRFEDKDKD